MKNKSTDAPVRRPRVSLEVLETLLNAVCLTESCFDHPEDYDSYGPVGVGHKEALRRVARAKTYVQRLIVWLERKK